MTSAAAENARRAKQIRARIRADIAEEPVGYDSRRRCAEHVSAPDPSLASVLAIDIVMWCRQVGRGYALGLLDRALIGRDRTIGSLTPRERARLADALLEPRPRENVALGQEHGS